MHRKRCAIWTYISDELQNPRAAERVVGSITAAIDRLVDFPKMGAALSTVARVESDYRFLVTGSYIAFYRISGKDIYVDRVLYGRRNYLRILFGDCTKE